MLGQNRPSIRLLQIEALCLKETHVIKKFVDGFSFGAGFAISFSVIWYISAYLIYPNLIESQIEEGLKTPPNVSVEPKPSESSASVLSYLEQGKQFHELTLDEQIRKATVIAVVKYEPDSDGRMKAVIKEFVKKEPGVKIHYDIGQEYPSSSYYPREDTNHGDGLVMFFTGSPATLKMSMTYAGDRIRSLGDIPLRLFREKCKKIDA